MRGFRELDLVLRGGATRGGERPSMAALSRISLLLAFSYGLCMGFYAVFNRPFDENPEFRQMLASAVKVPALFIITLVVTFPSLYVFNTLLGSRLHIDELAGLLAASMSVLMAVLAAFGPIVAFFSVTTASYPFVLLLNVAIFLVAGACGLKFLFNMLGALISAEAARRVAATADEPPPRREEPPTRGVFNVWMLVFGLVGAQMSWVLRPFIGSPRKEFTWFRPRESSFFEAVVRSFRQLFEG